MSTQRLPIRNEKDRAKAVAWVNRVPVGWTLVFKPPTRSTDQNRRLWAFLDDIAAQKTWDGKKRTSEGWKDLFSAALKTQEIVRGLEGGIVALGARTSEMSPEEMSDLLALIEAWGAQNDVVFTDTDKKLESLAASGGQRAGASTGAGAAPARDDGGKP